MAQQKAVTTADTAAADDLSELNRRLAEEAAEATTAEAKNKRADEAAKSSDKS